MVTIEQSTKIKHLAGALGAEKSGIDLTSNLTPADYQNIRALLI